MTGDLAAVLDPYVRTGALPGAVALVADSRGVEITEVGTPELFGSSPIDRTAMFRLASLTKPITAAMAMILVQDGVVELDAPIARWLPELADPVVVRTPGSPVDDVVPADRPITVFDLLTFRCGYGFASDFSLPAVQALFPVQTDGREVQQRPAPDEWLAQLAAVPLLYQPGTAWLYDTGADVLGVLLARATGSTLPDLLAERLFEPLGMADAGFHVPPDKLHRLVSSYRRDAEGNLELADPPAGQFSTPPAFPEGSGGLVGTVDDWFRFARLLLADGVAGDRALLSPASVRAMTTNHLTTDQAQVGALFLEGQGWGFGGSVDVADIDPWNVPGRYGWVGGTGTSAHIVPARGSVAILLAQVHLDDPVVPAWMRDFWLHAAGRSVG